MPITILTYIPNKKLDRGFLASKNISGCDLIAQFRRRNFERTLELEATAINGKIKIIDKYNGFWRFDLDPSDTDKLTQGYFDVHLVLANGDVAYKLIYGNYLPQMTVTRWKNE